jgi:hypothetical protein
MMNESEKEGESMETSVTPTELRMNPVTKGRRMSPVIKGDLNELLHHHNC